MTLKTVAQSFGDRPAVTWAEGTISYAELEQQVASIAGALRQRHDLEAGDRVGLAMTNCAEFFPVLYGLWRAGLTAVPMNSKLHARELAWILGNCSAKLVIATPDLIDKMSEYPDEHWPTTISTAGSDYQKLLQGA
ncbi:MAG: AMP-binding protein, partial [Pseudomonadota bacterium]